MSRGVLGSECLFYFGITSMKEDTSAHLSGRGELHGEARVIVIFNVVASHPNMHDYTKSITEPLPNLILLFCEKTRYFYNKILSRFNANHIDK